VDAVVKAESKAAKAKPVPHALNAVSAQSVVSAVSAVSAASVQTVIALPVKAVAMAARAHAVTTWLKDNAPTA
jgi:hypothetical protein